MSNDVLDSNLNSEGLFVTPEIKEFLRETAKWAKFIAILGFIVLGLMVVIGFTMGGMMTSMMSGMGDMPAGAGMMSGGILGFTYLVIFLIYLFPLLYLFRFGSKMKLALAQDDQHFLHEAFKNLKSHYKFMGILMIIGIAFYALILIMALVGMAAM